MAFKGLRFAAAEIWHASAGTVMKVVMVAISVIPLLYGGLYLTAFLDPYENLDTVPVAVVNEDAGAEVDGEWRVVGDDVVEKLADNHDGLGWDFVSADAAESGLETGKYYMTCTIPENFTETIASADSDAPEKAALVIDYNQTQNMLASQIGGTVWKEVRTQVSDTVAEEYWNTVFDRLNDGGDQIQEAADGAEELRDGLTDARKGSGTITTNLGSLADGSEALVGGLAQLVSGTLKLSDGSTALETGAKKLDKGASTLSGGASKLSSGASKLQKEGTGEVASGASKLQKQGTSEVASGASKLQKQGTSEVASGASKLQKEGTSEVASGASKLQKEGTSAVASGASKLQKEGTSEVASGASKLQKEGTSEVASGASKLQSGVAEVSSGISQLEGGIGNASDTSSDTLYGGVNQLISGLTELKGDTAQKKGLAYAAAGSHQLADGLSDTSALDGGISKLQAGVTKVKSGLINGGTESVDSALSAALAYLDANNDDAARQCIKEAQQAIGKTSDTSSDTLYGGLNQISAGLTSLQTTADGELDGASTAAETIADGLDEAVSGIGSADTPGKTLLYGATALKTGIGKLSSGTSKLASGIGTASDASDSTLYGGANLLASGAKEVDEKAGTLASGAKEVDEKAGTLASGAKEVDEKAGTLASGAKEVDEKAGTLASGAKEVDAQTSVLAAGVKKVNDKMKTLASGAKTVNTQMSKVASGASAVSSGASKLADGTGQAKSGVSQIAAGASQLSDGAIAAKDGSAKIADGAVQLRDGSQELTDGLATAEDGSGELADGLADGAEELHVDDASAKAEVMSAPVELDEEYFTTVKNYGTGFAPYFISLGLWVGALMAGFVLRPLNRRLVLSGGNPLMAAFSSFMPLALMSVVQALLLLVVLQFGLQLQIDNVGGYYAFGILTGLVFAAFMQFLMAAFGFPGKFIAIILLMLQLTSAAGTFPIEQTPTFFQVMNPFMPMTYVVAGMRQIMTGVDYNTVALCVAVLAGLGIVSFGLTALVARSKRMVRMEDLHPILQLG